MIASFVFDLDSTVLQGELLPAIGEQALGDRELRGRTMESVMGAAPFAQSFPARVARLRPVPVAQAAEIARCLPRYESLCAFLRAQPGAVLPGHGKSGRLDCSPGSGAGVGGALLFLCCPGGAGVCDGN